MGHLERSRLAQPATAAGATERGTQRGHAIGMAVLAARVSDSRAMQDPPARIEVRADCPGCGNNVSSWEIGRSPPG